MTEAKKIPVRGDTVIRMADALNDHAEKINSGLLQPRTVAQLALEDHDPSGSKMFFCTNESGGAIPVFSDGTNWRRVSDRAVAT